MRPTEKTLAEQHAAQAKFVEYTQSWARPAALEPEAVFRPWATKNLGPSGSLPAQVAAKVMDDFLPSSSDAFHWRLLEAYFSENRTISDREVLGDLAAEVGGDRDDFLDALSELWPVTAAQVIDEHNSAVAQGITAVPTTVIGGLLPVPGAQDVSSFINWIDRMLTRRSSASDLH